MRGILLALLVFVSLVAKSQGSVKQDSVKTKKIKLVPLPAVFYTPETEWGFGALLSGIFNTSKSGQSNTRNSNAQILAAYTLQDQIILQTTHNVFTNEERYSINGELSYYDFPILYYGIGNDTENEFEENLDYKVFIFRERVLKKLKKNLFAGLQYRYTYLYDLVYTPEFLKSDSVLLYNQQGNNSGLGFSFLHDSRDNVLNAYEGLFAQFSVFFHGKGLGGDYQFNRYTIDVRKFWALNERDVLAAQFFGEFNTGNTPFREMSLLGGDMIMRGYYNGRYRDNQQMAVQAEYRRQIISWIGVTAFGAFGDVSDDLGGFQLADFKYAVGGGLRIMVNKSDRANIRIDYGFGDNTSGFYFAFAEAF